MTGRQGKSAAAGTAHHRGADFAGSHQRHALDNGPIQARPHRDAIRARQTGPSKLIRRRTPADAGAARAYCHGHLKFRRNQRKISSLLQRGVQLQS
jgi:hypothetical protein